MTKEKPDVREELYRLTTKEKLVYRIIEDYGPIGTQEIMEKARLSRGSVMRGKRTLTGQGLIEERYCLENPNKKKFMVASEETGKRTELEKYCEAGVSDGS